MMQFLDDTKLPQMSFLYNGIRSADFLETWHPKITSKTAPDSSITYTTYFDTTTGLQVTITTRRFEGIPAVDWMVEFENTGSVDTPTLEDIAPCSISIPIDPKERMRLHYANGSSCRMDDFLPATHEIPPGSKKSIKPLGGRSSNGTLPFMNFQREGCGIVLCIGWSGQWAVQIERTQTEMRLAAGMEHTHLRLHPGEKIRTPRILLLLWDGADAEKGNNLLRRLLIDAYLPRLEGQLVMPPTAQTLQFYFYLTGQAGEALEMTALPKLAALGAEAYWIDACWYGGQGDWWQEVGSWNVNLKKFPHGLRPISDAAHKSGMKFLLWFEPERIRPKSQMHREHPEFLLECRDNPDNLLFNLGIPEARQHITDLISSLITEHGIDIYRQDFNFDPLPYWQAADQPDRVGMTEIRYVEGLYGFWDELLRRHPRLWIDNCASGGRRIDLETMTRSLPLWPSDFCDTIGLSSGLGLHIGAQCINAGLARWVPLFGGGLWNFSPYSVRSQIIGGFTFGAHIDNLDLPGDDITTILSPNDIMKKGKSLLDDDFPMADAGAAIEEWKSIRSFFVGDFHLLLPLTISAHDWCAWQFHRKDLEAGIAVLFRRHRSPFPCMEVSLKDIDPNGQYQVSLSPGFQQAPYTLMNGKELAQITISLPEAPDSIMLHYTKVA